MALPLPRVVADVEAGGPIATAMKGINALTQSNLENQIKKVQAQYAPLTTQAEAASKLAYANLMGPQFLAKLLGNSDILANIPDSQKNQALNLLYQAGTGKGTGANVLNNLATNNASPTSNSLLGIMIDKLKNVFGGTPQTASNPLISSTSSTNLSPLSTSNISAKERIPDVGEINTVETGPYLNTPAGRALQNSTNAGIGEVQVSPESPKPSFNENVARYKSIIEEGKTLGKERGKAISDLGKEQLALSASSDVLDRLTGIVQNPTFQNMRSKIPFFQDKQLSVLSKIGTPEEQKLIGDFISTAQAFKAATVNSFKGRTLEKEFGLADKIKIDENDTMGVAQGKLASLTTLKELAQIKNNYILDLMTGPQHMDLGKASREANKMIDYKTVEKEVNKSLNPGFTLMYKKNKQYRIPNNRIEDAIKAGYSNG